jgi:hypothetical protein
VPLLDPLGRSSPHPGVCRRAGTHRAISRGLQKYFCKLRTLRSAHSFQREQYANRYMLTADRAMLNLFAVCSKGWPRVGADQGPDRVSRKRPRRVERGQEAGCFWEVYFDLRGDGLVRPCRRQRPQRRNPPRPTPPVSGVARLPVPAVRENDRSARQRPIALLRADPRPQYKLRGEHLRSLFDGRAAQWPTLGCGDRLAGPGLPTASCTRADRPSHCACGHRPRAPAPAKRNCRTRGAHPLALATLGSPED